MKGVGAEGDSSTNGCANICKHERGFVRNQVHKYITVHLRVLSSDFYCTGEFV